MRRSLWAVLGIVLVGSSCAEREPAAPAPRAPAVARAAPERPKPDTRAPTTTDASPSDAVTSETEQGCERRFPAVDMSWTETLSFVTRLHDANGIPSFMISDQTETITGNTRYRVLSAAGSDVTLLQVAPAPGEPVEFDAREIGLTESGEAHDPSPPLSRESALTDLDRMHVGHSGLSATLAKARPNWVVQKRAADVEHALQPLLAELVGDNVKIEARYAGERRSPEVAEDVFLLHVKGELGAAATCHGRTDKRDMFGELALRSADSALISLALSGRDDIVEDICKVDGRGRDILGRHIAHTELHLSAPCFRREVMPAAGSNDIDSRSR